MTLHEAILQLNTNVKSVATTVDNITICYDSNDNILDIDITQAQELVNSKAYIDSRRSEYPDIGDQLDDLFKAGAFSTEMTATLQAVKDKYPKE